MTSHHGAWTRRCPSPPTWTGPRQIAAARQAGADAVHPGYGFLAEDPSFAQAVERAGLTWVGPPAEAMAAMADKAAARRRAASLGIPVVPGYDGEGQEDATPHRRGDAHRLPAAHQTERRRRRQGDPPGDRPSGPSRRPRCGAPRGRPSLRRRPARAGAVPRRRATHRGPGPLRPRWPGNPPRRARLQRPAPESEDRRGVAGAIGLRGIACAHDGRRPGARARASATRGPAPSSFWPSTTPSSSSR